MIISIREWSIKKYGLIIEYQSPSLAYKGFPFWFYEDNQLSIISANYPAINIRADYKIEFFIRARNKELDRRVLFVDKTFLNFQFIEKLRLWTKNTKVFNAEGLNNKLKKLIDFDHFKKPERPIDRVIVVYNE